MPLNEVLDSYVQAINASKAPKPVPQYSERFGWQPQQHKKLDLAFSLLQLFTGELSGESAEDLQDLLTPEAHTPEPLNAIFSWLLLQVLKAIGAVKPSPAVTTKVLTISASPRRVIITYWRELEHQQLLV